MNASPGVFALEVEGLSKTHQRRSGWIVREPEVRAFEDIGFRIRRGAGVAVAGPSGAGKSSLARSISLLETPSGGRLVLDGIEVCSAAARRALLLRGAVQMVFQGAAASLNPHMSISDIVTEPLVVRAAGPRAELRRRAAALLATVGLGPEICSATPRDLSGGEQKRVALARALAVSPRLLVLDEALAELDLITRSLLVRLLTDLRVRRNMACLLITHDLALAQSFAEEILVMDRGRIVERGPASAVVTRPGHPVTRRLVEARLFPVPPAAGRSA